MKREERYVVMKHADIDSALSDSDKLLLSAVLSKVERYRKEQHKEPLEAVVVEHDWPEYEQVWKMIETRVDREENNRKFETMLDNKERLGYFFVVETHQGKFLITSNAHSANRLKEYTQGTNIAPCSALIVGSTTAKSLRLAGAFTLNMWFGYRLMKS